MLTASEKDYLYDVISSVLGEDQTIKQYRHGFNESTVSVVEKMIDANSRCNDNMKQLLVDLMLAGSIATKGWLRKALKEGRKKIDKEELRGYACLVSVKSRWKTAIISTAI